MVEYCTMSIWGTFWNRVWVLVNTLKHGAIVWRTPMGWHEVARVLQSPCWWTPSFSWDHCNCHPCWSITQSTGNIVLENSFEWCSPCFILSSIHIAPPLHSRLVCKVVWIIGHAEVVGTSSSVAKPASSSPSCIHQLSSIDIWAASFSPPCVDHPSIPWARWTCCSLLSSLSLRPTRTRQPISPIPSISPSQYLNIRKGACIYSILCGCTPLFPVQSFNWRRTMKWAMTIPLTKKSVAMLEQLGGVPLAVPHQRWSTGAERIVSWTGAGDSGGTWPNQILCGVGVGFSVPTNFTVVSGRRHSWSSERCSALICLQRVADELKTGKCLCL